MTIRVGCQRPGGNWVARQIAAHDEPRTYCHAALVFGDDLVYEAHIEFGVRFRLYAPDPAAWTFWSLDLTAEQLRALRQWCELHAGDGYDVCGVAAMALPFVREDGSKWFCSELVVAALQSIGLLAGEAASKVTPNKLSLLMPAVVALPEFELPPVGDAEVGHA